MLFTIAGGLVSGGWDALSNITSGIGKGISRIGSTFFPGPQQQQPIQSQITQMGNYSSVPKPVTPDAPTVWEAARAAEEWLTAPIEPPIFTGPDISVKEPGLFENIVSGLGWAATQSRNIRTLADEIMGPWQPRETVYGTPQAGSPEGQNEQHLNNLVQQGAKVWEMAKTGAGAFLDQVKGLFNLGFPQQGAQPAFAIQHEITPSKGLSTGLIIAGVVIVLIILLSRKK